MTNYIFYVNTASKRWGAKMIQRKEYLDNLIALKDKQVIKVVTGVRRCGKSTLFELYIEYLKQIGVENSQLYRSTWKNWKMLICLIIRCYITI